MVDGKYSYKDICQYIIAKSNEEENFITNLQLQKMLYYVQGYFLKNYGFPAFCSNIEAWQYGPVVSEAYYDYCVFGRGYITVDEDIDYNLLIERREERTLINKVFDVCRKISIGDLIDKTHKEAPWKNTKNLRAIINISDIYNFFEENDPLNIGG